MPPVLKRICQHHGWVVLERSDEVRGRDWLITPNGHLEGPVLAFKTVQAALTHAERHEALTGTESGQTERRV